MAAPAPLVKFNPASVSSLNVPKKERRIVAKTSQSEKLIRVFRSHTKIESEADYQVTESFARKLVRARCAHPIHYGQALRLRNGFDMEPAEPRECKFPARALREYRNQLLSEINRYPSGIRPISKKIQARLRLVRYIDQMRTKHAALANGCTCCYTPEEIKFNVTAAERNSAE